MKLIKSDLTRSETIRTLEVALSDGRTVCVTYRALFDSLLGVNETSWEADNTKSAQVLETLSENDKDELQKFIETNL